jgi:hypothetical protein
MIWELTSDAAGDKSLLSAIHATIVEAATTQKSRTP